MFGYVDGVRQEEVRYYMNTTTQIRVTFRGTRRMAVATLKSGGLEVEVFFAPNELGSDGSEGWTNETKIVAPSLNGSADDAALLASLLKEAVAVARNVAAHLAAGGSPVQLTGYTSHTV